MLANGATLKYATTSTGSYTNLPGLQEISEIGHDAVRVDNTDLSSSIKTSENGIPEPGDVSYTFKYSNKAATDSYRILRGLDENTVYYWQETLADGTVTKFEGMPTVKRSGGGVDGLLTFTLGIAVCSDYDITDPT